MIARAKHIMMLLCGLALAGSAQAQETGSLVKHKAAQLDDDAVRSKSGARLVAEQFGACVVDRSAGRSAKWVDLPVDSKQFADMRDTLVGMTDACMGGGEMSVSSILLRGTMLQALYLRQYAKKPAPVFAPDATSGYRATYPEQLSPMARQAIAMEQFGECVSKADPQNVQKLLIALSGSGGESDSFAALAPRFSACIIAGENLSFSKLVLKNALAEGMYRLTRAAEAGSAGKS